MCVCVCVRVSVARRVVRRGLQEPKAPVSVRSPASLREQRDKRLVSLRRQARVQRLEFTIGAPRDLVNKLQGKLCSGKIVVNI